MITVDKLYQWDLNRTVTVNDAADEMHWQQPYSGAALRTSIVDGKANIPNIVLQQHGKIKCWSYDSANGRTVNVYEIDISRRQKPNNYVYTETEAKTVEQYVYDYLANGQVQFSWNNITDKPNLYSKEEVDAISEHKADLREGKIPREQLPNVVKECPSFSEFPETGETGVIYIDTATNNTYRWDGEIYAPLAYFGTQATAHEISITPGEWSGNSVTKNVTGVTADCIVIVAPLPDSQDGYVNAKIKCTAQGAGTLTFTCATAPSQTITIGAVIIK